MREYFGNCLSFVLFHQVRCPRQRQCRRSQRLILRSHFGSGQETYPTGPSTHVAALCSGALAAAAVSSSQSLGELVQAGIDAVRVSLRVGLLVARTAALFDHPQSNISSSWSYVVPESQFPLALAEKAIASYKDNSVSRCHYIPLQGEDDIC